MNGNLIAPKQQRQETIGWKLLYADGRSVAEPARGGTIKEAWDNPIELQLINQEGEPFMRVPLDAAKGQKPIFYRRRSIEYKLSMASNVVDNRPVVMLGSGQTFDPATSPKGQLDATVFGWASARMLDHLEAIEFDPDKVKIDLKFDCQLWVILPDGRYRDCPPPRFNSKGKRIDEGYFDEKAIEGQVLRNFG